MAAGVNLTVLVSTALSLLVPAPPSTRPGTEERPGTERRPGTEGRHETEVRPRAEGPSGRARPELFLALVVGLVYLNQVLFTVYVLRVHGGDPAFIARHLPDGWFALADGPAMREFAQHVPAPELLAPTVLRVQAFLELPLVLLAYVTVLRWLDRALYRRLATSWPIWAASISYTIVFCVVEWDLRNPYTTDDIVIRVCSAAATPFLLQWLARREDDAPTETSFPQMLLFAASTWALGHLVLTVYDTALLYNLAHLPGRLPGALAALCLLVGARWAASRVGDREPPGAALTSIAAGLRRTLALFLIPALAVRYGVNFGHPLVAVAAAFTVCFAAAAFALREALSGLGRARVALWTAQVAAALLGGGAAGLASVLLVPDTYYEAGLLRGAAVCFTAAVVICALTDRWIAHRRAPVPGRP